MLEVIDKLPFILLSCVGNPSDDTKENLQDADRNPFGGIQLAVGMSIFKMDALMPLIPVTNHHIMVTGRLYESPISLSISL